MTTTLDRTVALDGVGMDFAVKGGTFTALDDISFALPEGGFTTLLGPSGCGKSTLLRIIADVMEPTRGTVDLFDQVRQVENITFGSALAQLGHETPPRW